MSRFFSLANSKGISFVLSSLILCSASAFLISDAYTSYLKEYEIATMEAENLTISIESLLSSKLEKIDLLLIESVNTYRPLLAQKLHPNVLSVNKDLLRRENHIPETQRNSLRIIDANGNVLYSAGNTSAIPAVNVADREYFQKQKNASSQSLLISEPILSRFTGHWLFTVSRPIISDDNQFLGIIQTAIRADYLESTFSALQIGGDANISLFSENFNLIARKPEILGQIGKSFDLSEIKSALSNGQIEGTYHAKSRIDGVDRFFHFKKINQLPLIINIGQDPRYFLKGWHKKISIYFIFIFVLFIELLILIYVVTSSAKNSIKTLERLVQERTSDLTESNQLLSIAKDEAEKANSAKSKFIAAMSHELRTPMNGILGMAQVLNQDTISDAERKEYADIILNSGNVLLNILNDILDFSKIDSNHTNLKLEPCTPVEIVNLVIQLNMDIAKNSNIMLVSEFAGKCNLSFILDKNRLLQMLNNLVGNAIKFSNSGTVKVICQTISTSTSFEKLKFSVVDSGIGIPDESIPLLFEPFRQLDDGPSRRYGGTGLGLSIVKSLVLLMNGQIGVNSKLGIGSEFWFEIPAKVSEHNDTETRQIIVDSEHVHNQCDILIVDDNAVNRKLLEVMLQKEWPNLYFAENGQIAVNLIKSGLRPHVILMDTHMPVVDGLQATMLIREFESNYLLSKTPIIAISASAFSEDIENCLNAGSDMFLAKPFNQTELIHKIQILLSD